MSDEIDRITLRDKWHSLKRTLWLWWNHLEVCQESGVGKGKIRFEYGFVESPVVMARRDKSDSFAIITGVKPTGMDIKIVGKGQAHWIATGTRHKLTHKSKDLKENIE